MIVDDVPVLFRIPFGVEFHELQARPQPGVDPRRAEGGDVRSLDSTHVTT